MENSTSLPVNKNATPEARQLLRYIYSISGKRILSAQHENLGSMSKTCDSIYQLTGKYPAIWGGDFGFSDERHDMDNIKYRPALLKEIVKQHEAGAIITMTYHQANPVEGEPCLFDPGVIGQLTRQQYEELLTPGTPVYNKWCEMVDLLAEMFKTLQDKHIPVLFRPYHEMNGGWFWWSGTRGDSCYIRLYIQMYNYLTYHHKLNNLIWVWAASDYSHGFDEYYPGDEYVDIIACDIYPKKENPAVEATFTQGNYEALLKIAGNKPLAIGECSLLPDEKILKKQPRWVWAMGWVNMIIDANGPDKVKEFYDQPGVLDRDESNSLQSTIKFE